VRRGCLQALEFWLLCGGLGVEKSEDGIMVSVLKLENLGNISIATLREGADTNLVSIISGLVPG